MALHGQSDQQRLLKPAQQRGALDRYAGEPVVALRERFAATWAQWRDVRATLAQLRAEAAERVRESELLRLGLAEVEAAEPLTGEDAALVAEVERLANADDLRTAAAIASQALTGDESEPDAADALSLTTAARRALEAAAAHDPQLAALAARLVDLGHLVTDVALELSSYLASVDADPVRLSVAQERLAVLTGLVRRHGADDLDGVLAWADRASRRLLELDGAEDRIGALEQQDAELEAALGRLGAELSDARSAAAERFGAAVSAELVELAMPHARVSARVSQTEDPDGLPVGDRRLAATADGVDDVELLLEPHPGAPARALQKGASGGELSRVMLAVEVVFAGSDPVPLMVFDEVDAGVGGRAAVEVGRRLARLARDHQVVVVTHLPQVAAFADRHLQVVKAERRVRHPQRRRRARRRGAGRRAVPHARRCRHGAGPRPRRGAARRRRAGPRGAVVRPAWSGDGRGARLPGGGGASGRLGADEDRHAAAQPAGRATARHDRRGPAGPADQEPHQAAQARRDRDHRPRRHRPGQRGPPGHLPGRRRRQRRPEHQRPLPQPRSRDPAGGGHPAAGRRRGHRLRRGPGRRHRAPARRHALRQQGPGAGGRRRRRTPSPSGRRWPRPAPGSPPSWRPSPRTRWSTCSRSATCSWTASGSPRSRTQLEGRHALIVVRGYDYREDLRALRPYIREYRPILIGVDGGADALVENGYTPDLIVGDMDSVSDEVLRCGAEVVVHAYADGHAPGLQRVQDLGVEAIVFPAAGTSEDVAMLLADEAGASLIVAVGTHATLVEFLDKGRQGMASTFLTRLRVGGKLVDAKGVSRLYRQRISNWSLLLLVLATLVAMAAAVFVSSAGQAYGDLLRDAWEDLVFWVEGLF